MQRFKKILFVNEPGTNTLTTPQRAVQLARDNNAQLTLCDVSKELPRTLTNIDRAFKLLHEDQMKSLFEKFSVEGVNIKTRLLTGIPFVEIITEVIRGGHDLVIKSAEGSDGILNSIFGSTDLHLMRKCPCPVWIIKPSKRKKYTRILAAVDPDPEVPANAELNTLILDLATFLARQENSELHIVHAWHLHYESFLRNNRAGMTESEINLYARDARKNHKQWLDDLLKGYDMQGLASKVHFLKGEPGKIIPTVAKKERVELIVMGTVARTGIPGFFIGNTAEKILASVDCSVLTVKPKGFLTPVKS